MGLRAITMLDQESHSAHYRRLAQDCLRMVRQVSTEEARTILVEMAQIWMRMADTQDPARATVQRQPKDDVGLRMAA
jgi:hypothetical protein